MKWKLKFLVVAGLLAGSPAQAWGPEGHEIVAAIAARELTPATRAQVSALLGGPADAMMVLDSNWADEIRAARPQTAAWHYVNIEIGSGGYDARRDCPQDACVVAQIERDTRLLADPRTARSLRIEALRFLIHFIGDVHQPLHAADRHDRGGNAVTVRWRGQRTSLHRVWDQDVIAALGFDAGRIAAEIESRLTPRQKMQMGRGTAAAWADESFVLAGRRIYPALPEGPVPRLPADYARRQGDLVRLQLARAGLRLAATLNRLYGR